MILFMNVNLAKDYGFFFLIEVELIYSVVLVTGVQQSNMYRYIFFFIMVYYKRLNTVPCAIS